MPVYSDNLSPTTCSNPATSLNQSNLVSRKTKDNWTDIDPENMEFEEMFSYQVPNLIARLSQIFCLLFFNRKNLIER